MPDDIDVAQARDLEYQADCERERKFQAAHAVLECTGFCRYCYESTGGGLRFCDAECRDAWDHERKLRLMQGVK